MHDDMYIKAIGYFTMGLLHIKIPLSYTHMNELIDEDSKSFSSSTITFIEITSMAWVGLSLEFFSKDITVSLFYLNVIQSVGVVLYILIVPESPKWLFMNDQKEKAIEVLNYISKFNGS